jgi:hypothetical protein
VFIVVNSASEGTSVGDKFSPTVHGTALSVVIAAIESAATSRPIALGVPRDDSLLGSPTLAMRKAQNRRRTAPREP